MTMVGSPNFGKWTQAVFHCRVKWYMLQDSANRIEVGLHGLIIYHAVIVYKF